MSKSNRKKISEMDISEIKVLMNELSKKLQEKDLDKISNKLRVDKELLSTITKQKLSRKGIYFKRKETKQLKEKIKSESLKQFDIIQPLNQDKLKEEINTEDKDAIEEFRELGIDMQILKPPEPELLEVIQQKQEEEEKEISDIKSQLIIKREIIEKRLENTTDLIPKFKKDEFQWLPLTINRNDPEIKENIEKGLILGMSLEDILHARGLSLRNLNRQDAQEIILLDQLIAEGMEPESAVKRLRTNKWALRRLEKAKINFLEEHKDKLLEKVKKQKKKPKRRGRKRKRGRRKQVKKTEEKVIEQNKK